MWAPNRQIRESTPIFVRFTDKAFSVKRIIPSGRFYPLKLIDFVKICATICEICGKNACFLNLLNQIMVWIPYEFPRPYQ